MPEDAGRSVVQAVGRKGEAGDEISPL